MSYDSYFAGWGSRWDVDARIARRTSRTPPRGGLEAMSDEIATALAAAASRPVVRRKSDAQVEAEVLRALAGAAGRQMAMSREGQAERSYEFRATGGTGDGRVLEGYAAVFDTPTRIRGWEGDFTETIRRGAFERSLTERTPVLQFDHGRDARVGSVPIGAIDEVREDDNGLFVRAHLFANDVVEPVRQAIAGKAIRGMSFRFEVPDGGDTWSRDKKHREIHQADVAELGPVVFPAYDSTSVTVRRR